MNKTTKIVVFSALAIILAYAIWSIVEINTNTPKISLFESQNRSVIDSVLKDRPTASWTTAEKSSYTAKFFGLMKASDKITLVNKCEPDIVVAKVPWNGMISFVNQARFQQEIVFGQKSYFIPANNNISVSVSDVLPPKSATSSKSSEIVRSYRCRGSSDPIGYLVVSTD